MRSASGCHYTGCYTCSFIALIMSLIPPTTTSHYHLSSFNIFLTASNEGCLEPPTTGSTTHPTTSTTTPPFESNSAACHIAHKHSLRHCLHPPTTTTTYPPPLHIKPRHSPSHCTGSSHAGPDPIPVFTQASTRYDGYRDHQPIAVGM